MSDVIDGKAIAAGVRGAVASAVSSLVETGHGKPGLAVVLVGQHPASQVYVRSKGKATVEAGMESFEHRLSADVTEAELLTLIGELNTSPKVHGILVQLPLPQHIDEAKVIAAINPGKDVDGFHVSNAGALAIGEPRLVPCTPLGSLHLIRGVHGRDLSGLNAVVLGRSNIVGKPMGQLLLGANATVTIAHSRTADLPALCRQADILVAAVDRAQMVQGDWIKPGATVIDVGINRLDPTESHPKGRLVGDVDYDSAAELAGAITPVPGGVGTMTMGCHLVNTVIAYFQSHDLSLPDSLAGFAS